MHAWHEAQLLAASLLPVPADKAVQEQGNRAVHRLVADIEVLFLQVKVCFPFSMPWEQVWELAEESAHQHSHLHRWASVRRDK